MDVPATSNPTRPAYVPQSATYIGELKHTDGSVQDIWVIVRGKDAPDLTNVAQRATEAFNSVISKHNLDNKTILTANNIGIAYKDSGTRYNQTHESKEAVSAWKAFEETILAHQIESPQIPRSTSLSPQPFDHTEENPFDMNRTLEEGDLDPRNFNSPTSSISPSASIEILPSEDEQEALEDQLETKATRQGEEGQVVIPKQRPALTISIDPALTEAQQARKKEARRYIQLLNLREASLTRGKNARRNLSETSDEEQINTPTRTNEQLFGPRKRHNVKPQTLNVIQKRPITKS